MSELGNRLNKKRFKKQKLIDTEEKFRKIFEAIPDLYFLVNNKGKHLDFKGNEELLFLTPDMFLGKKIKETLPEDVSKKYYTAIKNTLETKKPTIIEYSLPINNIIHHYEARNLYFSENRVAIFVRDVTEQKNVQKELINEKKFTEAALNAQRDTFFVFDPTTSKAIRWNKAFSEISGYTDEEIANLKAPESYYTELDLNTAAKAIEQVDKEGKALLEMNLITKDGKSIPFEYLATNIKDEEGNTKYIVSIGRDITERKKIEKKLRESELHYRMILNSMNDPIHVIDENFTVITTNPAFTQYLKGFNFDNNIVGGNLFKLFKFLPNQVKKEYEKIFSDGNTLVTLEKNEIDGQVIYTEVTKIPIIRSGKVNQVITIVRDITERKQTELALYYERDLIRVLLENHPDFIYFKDSKARFQHISKRFCEFFGRNMEDIIGKTDLELFPEEIAKQTYSEDLHVIKTGQSLINKEESAAGTWVLTTKIPWDDKEGNVKGLFGISRDITERKGAELKLKESEEKFRTITEQSLMGICIVQDNKIEYINKAYANIFGYTVEEMMMWELKDAFNAIHPDDREFTLEQLAKKQRGDKDIVIHYQYRGIKKSGEIIWVDQYSKPFIYRSKPANFITIIDITERKKTHQKLKESEKRFRDERDNLINMLNSMEDGVYIINQHYEIEFVNPTLKNAFGPVGNKKCYEYFQNLLEPCPWCKNQENITQGSIRWEWDSPITNKFYEIISTPIKGSDKSVSKLVIFHDITDRKKAEQKLIESEDKFRTIAEQAVVGISIIQDNEVKYINQKSLDYFGYTKEEVEKWPPGYFINVIHPDFRELILEITRKNQSDDTEEPSHVEIKTVKKNGEIQWAEVYLRSIIFNEKPAVMNIIVDITERKKAVEKIKRARERADMYLNLVNVIIVALDKDGNVSLINKKGNNILGWDEGELINKNWFEICLPPHDRDRVFDYFKKLMNGEIDVVPFYENPVLTKDGKERLIAWSTILLKDSNGYITGLLSSGEDITDRKKAQKKLIESEERYRILFESSPVGIGIADFEGNVYSMNPAMEEITGYDLESYRKINLKNTYVNPDDRIKLLKEIKESGKVRNYLVNLLRKNGEVYDALLNIETTDIMNKKSIITNIQDISERIKVQKKLKELSKLKSELLTRTSHELKTPAMHIKGYADLLLHKYKDNLGIDELQIISHIKKGVLRLETLIYDIMHKAELDSSESELNKNRNNLSSLIELSVKELMSFAALRGHSIKLDIDNDMITDFDTEQIRHVLNNLLTNAIKYTPLNGIIGINSTITDDFITIAVQDNGIGLTKEQINQLFTQFGKIERYGQGFDIITEGSGLGLHIAKKIIDLHGGKIWVESGGINKGSTFYFSIPKTNN